MESAPSWPYVLFCTPGSVKFKLVDELQVVAEFCGVVKPGTGIGQVNILGLTLSSPEKPISVINLVLQYPPNSFSNAAAGMVRASTIMAATNNTDNFFILSPSSNNFN